MKLRSPSAHAALVRLSIEFPDRERLTHDGEGKRNNTAGHTMQVDRIGLACRGSKSGWKKYSTTARENAGVPNALFHDVTRAAFINMIERGFSEKEAIEMSGTRQDTSSTAMI